MKYDMSFCIRSMSALASGCSLISEPMRFSPKPTWRRSSAIVPESVCANFGFISWFMACIISKTLKAMPSSTMFWPTTPATKSFLSTFSSSTLGELHQVRVGVAAWIVASSSSLRTPRS